MSPYSRTKQLLEQSGCVVVKLESYNKWARRRVDVWGADMLARQGRLGMAIQATDHTSHSKHVDRALNHPGTIHWLKIGINFYIYSWGKKGPRGKRKVWTPRVTQLVLNGDDKAVVL